MMKLILAQHEGALLHDDNFKLQHTDDYIDVLDITNVHIGTQSRYMPVGHPGFLSRSANAIGSEDIVSNTEDVNDVYDNNNNVDQRETPLGASAQQRHPVQTYGCAVICQNLNLLA